MRRIEEFWVSVDVRGPHECWRWMRCLDSGGYGSLQWRGRSEKAHRVALGLSVENPGGLFALHHCDVRSCCNPLHLYWGTQLENNRDRASRGRNNSEARCGDGNGMRKHPDSVPRGSRQGGAKLTEAIVAEIRRLRLRPCEVRRRYGIGSSQAKRIVRGETWKHVEVQP